MDHDHSQCHSRMHCCMKVAKIVLQAAAVAAGFAIASEIHRVHRSIESRHNEGKRRLL